MVIKQVAKQTRVLNAFFEKRVTVTGVLHRRGDGRQGNLNLVSPAFINGIKIEHLNVYDEVIDGADMDYETGCFIASGCVVYKYMRSDGHQQREAFGIKPHGAPRMHNEV